MKTFLDSLQGMTGATLVLCALALVLIAIAIILLVKWCRRRVKQDFGVHHLKSFPFEEAKRHERDNRNF